MTCSKVDGRYQVIFIRNLFMKKREFLKYINWRCIEEIEIICPISLFKLNITESLRTSKILK